MERVRPEIPGSSGTRSRNGHSYRTVQARGRVESNVSGENDYGSSNAYKSKSGLLIKVTQSCVFILFRTYSSMALLPEVNGQKRVVLLGGVEKNRQVIQAGSHYR